MEYTLRVFFALIKNSLCIRVLILIIVEYTLREYSSWRQTLDGGVLILIIVEYTLRVEPILEYIKQFSCLNPYYSGIYSTRAIFIGKSNYFIVLILIIVEYTLRG